MLVDLEDLTVKVSKDIEHFQSRYNLNHREMANILLTLGLDCYLQDIFTRQMNGQKIPYLANWHLRQGWKYYRQYLGSKL